LTESSGSETYTYDAGGRVTAVQKVVGITAYAIGYQFNVADEPTQITYPSGRQLQYGYDAVGNLLTATSGTTTFLSIPATSGYSAANQPLTFTYGNGVTGTFTYSSSRSQLASLQYSNSAQTLFGLNYYYSYDATNCAHGTTSDNGQIGCIVDTVQPGRTAAYSYDPLRRLSTAVTSGSSNYPAWGLSEAFDRYGNRLSQTVTAGTGPAASFTFTTNNRPSGYTYDAAGNLIIEPLTQSNTYSYDQQNRLITFSGNGGSATYSYDDNNHRVIKAIQSGTTTVYIYAGDKVIAEYDNGAAPSAPSREYIYGAVGPNRDLGPELVAKIDVSGTQYYLQDHLSVRLMTDSSGNKLGEQGNFPFGESWYATNTTTKWTFTTYERDQDTGNNSGLDYAMARFYDNRVASFCSADPLEGRPDDPQSWNRYAYAQNDPINMTDPSGKGLFSWIADIILILVQIFTGLPTATLAFADLGAGALPIILLPPPDLVNPAANATPQRTPPPTSSKEGQGTTQTSKGPPPPPPGYKTCGDPLPYTVRGVGGHQAEDKGAGGNYPNRPGNVAYNPNDFGLSESEAHALDRSANPILFKPDWNNATIPGQAGTGRIPSGLPVSTDQTLAGRDTLGGPGVNRGEDSQTIDVYGYKTKRIAYNSTRQVPTTIYYPTNGPGHCPQ
jgi:RHS repeat-associated protein